MTRTTRNVVLAFWAASALWPAAGAEMNFDAISGLIEHGSWRAARREIEQGQRQEELGFAV